MNNCIKSFKHLTLSLLLPQQQMQMWTLMTDTHGHISLEDRDSLILYNAHDS